MKQILRPPITAPFGVFNGKSYKILLADFYWYDPVFGWIVVPKGFVFDGASIPRIAWSVTGVTPFSNEIICAAVVHDYLYTNFKFLAVDGEVEKVTRKEADQVFLRIMKYQGHLGMVKRNVFYRSVRMCGGFHKGNEKDVEIGFSKFREDVADRILLTYQVFDPDLGCRHK